MKMMTKTIKLEEVELIESMNGWTSKKQQKERDEIDRDREREAKVIKQIKTINFKYPSIMLFFFDLFGSVGVIACVRIKVNEITYASLRENDRSAIVELFDGGESMKVVASVFPDHGWFAKKVPEKKGKKTLKTLEFTSMLRDPSFLDI